MKYIVKNHSDGILLARLCMWNKEKQAIFSESASDILCYFHLLQKHCQSIWEFDNKFLYDGHIVV